MKLHKDKFRNLRKPASLVDFSKWFLVVISLAALYYGAAQLGILLALPIPPNNITAVWPPAAIALGAVFWLGYGVAPGIWLGDILVNLPIYIDNTDKISTSILVAVTKATASTAAAILAAYLIQRFVGKRCPFNRALDVFKFVLIVMLCPIISTNVGLGAMCLAGICQWTNYQQLWFTFWLGDSISLVVFTPMLLIWKYHHRINLEPRKCMEALIFLIVLLAVGRISFGMGYPVEHLVIPCLLWGAFRFGQVGAITSVFLVCCMAIAGTVLKLSSFARNSLNEAPILLQTFMGVVTVTTLVLVAVLEERRRYEKALKTVKEQLELGVEERTAELQKANQQLVVEIAERKQIVTALRQSQSEKTQLIVSLQEQTKTLEQTLQNLQITQAQLIQTEKMSSLGQLVAGVAHEINNPVTSISANLKPLTEYTHDLLNIIDLYQKHYPPQSNPVITAAIEKAELEYISEDIQNILSAMERGAERILEIVLNLRSFSRIDESQMKPVNLHEGLDSTLLILQHRLKGKAPHPGIAIIKEYGDLPAVECYGGQINQVFMNIISNAIDALYQYDETRSIQEIKQHPSSITVRTQTDNYNRVTIRIKDNGFGITEDVKQRLFDPFFTTKPVGRGTGLGLSISHQIVVDKHRGKLWCISELEEGTEFVIELPMRQIPQSKLMAC
ncbi:MAG: MASE1 domain-containing protein [Nostocaceae cyanobacterium]|nr:MASE1 domain-containing protein [Nostocaceae cyanobacterium]